jgi:hypothetical protein
MYLDAKAHSAFTGTDVTIERVPGTAFRAFDGMLTGKVVHVEPKRLIVQTWRSSNWPAEAMDSVLTLSFWPDRDGARIELVHVNVHEEDFAGVSQGWERIIGPHYGLIWRGASRPNQGHFAQWKTPELTGEASQIGRLGTGLGVRTPQSPSRTRAHRDADAFDCDAQSTRAT